MQCLIGGLLCHDSISLLISVCIWVQKLQRRFWYLKRSGFHLYSEFERTLGACETVRVENKTRGKYKGYIMTTSELLKNGFISWLCLVSVGQAVCLPWSTNMPSHHWPYPANYSSRQQVSGIQTFVHFSDFWSKKSSIQTDTVLHQRSVCLLLSALIFDEE